MKNLVLAALGVLLLSSRGSAQAKFDISGTLIPTNLLQQNYGPIPRGIGAYDMNICNVTDQKESIVSSRIYQALSTSNPTLEPIGREIMFAAILRNQNHSLATILTAVLNSTTGVLRNTNWHRDLLGRRTSCSIWTAAYHPFETDPLSRSATEVREPGSRTGAGAGWWFLR